MSALTFFRGSTRGRARVLLFVKSGDPVQRPGSRGGVGYYDGQGRWQYGERPPLREPRSAFEREVAKYHAIDHERRKQLDPAIRHYEEHGGAVEFEHRYGDRLAVSVLSKRPTAAGGHRITHFDESGPSGHTEHDTLADAVKRLYEGSTLTGRVNQGHLDRWVGTSSWNEGMARHAHMQKWAPIRERWQREHWPLFDTDRAAWEAAAAKLREEEDADFERTLAGALAKSTQLGLFREDVKAPGSRGGRYYRDKRGKVRYGDPPVHFGRFRLDIRRNESILFPGTTVHGIEDAAVAFRHTVNADRERFQVVALDANDHVLAVETISVGSVNSTLVHPRETFRAPVALGATRIIHVHNHPTGDPSPSAEDLALNERLVHVGLDYGIAVSGVVVAREGWQPVGSTEKQAWPTARGKVPVPEVTEQQLTAWQTGARIAGPADIARALHGLHDPGAKSVMLLLLDGRNRVLHAFSLGAGLGAVTDDARAAVARQLAAIGPAAMVMAYDRDGRVWSESQSVGWVRLLDSLAERHGVRLLDAVELGPNGEWKSRHERGTLAIPESLAAADRSRNLITHEEARAIVAAAREKWGEEPNAARLELLLHPHVYRVWRKLNPNWHVARVTHPKWGPGYEVYATGPVRQANGKPFRSYWNRARDDHRWAHSPSTAWEGVYRNTVHTFLDDLMQSVHGYDATDTEPMGGAYRAGLKVVRSTAMPEGVAVGDRFERASGEVVRVIGAEDDELLLEGGGRLGINAVRAGRVRKV